MNIVQRIFGRRERLVLTSGSGGATNGRPIVNVGGIDVRTPWGIPDDFPPETELWADTQDRPVTKRSWNAAQSDRLDFTVNWSDGENPRDLIVSVHVDWIDDKDVKVEVNRVVVAVYNDAHGLVAFGVPDQVKRAMRSVSADLNDLAGKAQAVASLLKRQIELVEKGTEPPGWNEDFCHACGIPDSTPHKAGCPTISSSNPAGAHTG